MLASVKVGLEDKFNRGELVERDVFLHEAVVAENILCIDTAAV